MRVPAWEVAIGEYSAPDYVFVLMTGFDQRGYHRSRLVHRLTPVDQDEQLEFQRQDEANGRAELERWESARNLS
jgi:hypothetical protein